MARKYKDEVEYTSNATDMSEQCKLCAHFYTVGAYDSGRCTRVEGEINSGGWCNLFKRLEK